MSRIAFAFAVLLQSATPAKTVTPVLSTYRIVLADGTEYVARGQYTVKGRLAVFTLASGQVVSIPLNAVNEPATRAVNAPPPAQTTPPATAQPAAQVTLTPRKARTRIVLSGTPQAYENPRPVARFPGVLRFTGGGSRVITGVGLDPGLYVFRGEHVGNSNFAVWLSHADGRHVELLSNEIGTARTFKSARIESSEDYVLEVKADGEWTIWIEKPM